MVSVSVQLNLNLFGSWLKRKEPWKGEKKALHEGINWAAFSLLQKYVFSQSDYCWRSSDFLTFSSASFYLLLSCERKGEGSAYEIILSQYSSSWLPFSTPHHHWALALMCCHSLPKDVLCRESITTLHRSGFSSGRTRIKRRHLSKSAYF